MQHGYFALGVWKNGGAQIEMICWVGEDKSGGFKREVEMQDNVKWTSQTEADGEVTSLGDFQRGGGGGELGEHRAAETG